MKLLKNRTVIGLCCIVLSIIICFGLTPLFNSAMTAQVDIARLSKDVKKGDLISADMLETVSVGAHNLPQNIVKSKDSITGKYLKFDMLKGDYILSGKLSDKPLGEFEYLSQLDGTKDAMSITIKSFAAGLSAKLEMGDIVSLIASDYGDKRTTEMLPELQYIKVLAVTMGSGTDKASDGTPKKTDNGNTNDELPSTITLLVGQEQAEILADLEAKSKIHAVLVYRGAREEGQKFLDAQDGFIKAKTSTLNPTGTPTGPSLPIISPTQSSTSTSSNAPSTTPSPTDSATTQNKGGATNGR